MSDINSQELAAALFEEAGDALFLFDPETEQIQDVNPMAQRLSGFTRRELLPMKVTYLFRSEVPGGLQRLRLAFRRTGLFHSQEGFWLRHQKDETWVPVNLTVTRLHTEPRPMGLITARDISERRQAHALVKKAEEELRRVTRSIPDCLWSAEIDRAGHWVYRYYSPVVEKLTGRPPEFFLPGRERWLSTVHPDDRGRVEEAFARLQTGRSGQEEYRVVRPDGSVRWVRDDVLAATEPEPAMVRLHGVVSDITERKQLEEQFRQAQKMEAVGRLAGGVAHDFNNLLTAILGNVGLALAELPGDHPCLPLLADAQKAGQRAAELTRQLLSFSRRNPPRPALLDLNGSVRESVRLLQRTIDPRVAVQVRLEPALWPVQADATQVGQVLMNLCLNARDAMPAGGDLTLETANVTFPSADGGAPPTGREGEFVCLRVGDTGQGIAPEVREHLFEPFFTTKEPGKGTGLGLTIVFSIVKQHQGWIECHSEVGRGTRFEIYLPRLTSVPAPAPPPPVGGTGGGSELILLADDEAVIRRLGKAILERSGYRVLVAADGAEAVEVYRQRGHEIGLVILDLSMPRLSGREALGELRRLNPEVCVLFSSGNFIDQAGPEEDLGGAAGFVAKPYQPADLLRGVRSALDRSRGGTTPAKG